MEKDFEILARLPLLRVLNIKGDHITDLPPSIGKMKNLEYLELSENQIKLLPVEFSNLKNLQILYINNDQSFDLKTNLQILGRLPRLKELHLEGDHFVHIPGEIRMLATLESLYLSNNAIQELPKEVFQLRKLKYIDVTNNRMPNILLDQYREDLAPTIKIQF